MATPPTGPAETPTPDISDVPADRVDRLTNALAARDRENRMLVTRQAASIEVLRIIAASPDDPQPAFEMIARHARELCGADQGAVTEYDGTLIHMRATDGYTVSGYFPRPPDHENLFGRLVLGEALIHIRDRDATPEGSHAEIAQRLGSRSLLGVPLRHDGRVIGGIVVRKREPGGFTDAEIALVESFADQAVIAIASATTLRALRARTADLQESLEQQTATSEVLQAINASPGDLVPVFETMLDKVMRLCGVAFGMFYSWDGAQRHPVAARGLPPALLAFRAEHPESLTDTPPLSRLAVATGRAQQLGDVREGEGYVAGHPAPRALADLGGARTLLIAPLRKDDSVLGLIALYRSEVRLFSEREIAVVESFAAQAVIALENARLLGELRARTGELAARNSEFAEQIDHQSATIDVLKAMSASPGDAQPVFDLINRRAQELCGSIFGGLFEYDGELVHVRSVYGVVPGNRDAYVRAFPMAPTRGSVPLRAILDAKIVHIRDVGAEPGLSPAARGLGAKATLAIPMLRDGRAVGAITINAGATGGFSDTQVALLQTFAEQAVIAIRSAETFRELEARTAALAQRNSEFGERIDQQAATIDVLKVMSASPDDTQPVFDQIVRRARELCNGRLVGLFEYDGELVHFRALCSPTSTSIAEWATENATAAAYASLWPMAPTRQSITCRAILDREIIHVHDVGAVPDVHATIQTSENRSQVSIPLLRDGAAIGAITLTSGGIGAFSESQIELLKTFAEQAVIAIGSVATYRRLGVRTAELAARNGAFAVQVAHQAATIDVLKVMSSISGDTKPVFDIILARALELCGAEFGAMVETDWTTVELRAIAGWTPDQIENYARLYPRPLGTWVMDDSMRSGQPSVIADIYAESGERLQAVRDLEFRSQLTVPLLRDGKVIGCFAIGGRKIGAFNDSHVALLKTFAEQAVIAIGSVATFRELQDRTTELTRSVAELQALEEVLRAVNSSLDLETVLATIIDRAVPLAQADEGLIYEFSEAEQVFVPKAAFGMTEDRVAALRERRIRIGETYLGRSAADRAPVTVDDVQQDSSTPEARTLLQGIHAVLAVPLLRENTVVGGLVIRRRSEGAFAPATIALMQTFAAQSVIAIENARLFDQVQARTRDLNESLGQQTATADVLKLISRSVFDLDTVLDTLTRSAATLAGADTGSMRVRDGDKFRVGANFGLDPAYVDFIQSLAIAPGRGNLSSRVALSLAVEHIPDNLADDELSEDLKRNSPNRSALGVPLVRDGRLEGMFTLGRKVPRAFTQREIDLVQTFADQALIAIENARLFDEVQARTRDLAESLEMQSATADVLKVISRSVFDLDAVLETLVRSAASLCDAQNVNIRVREGDEYRLGASVGYGTDWVDFTKNLRPTPGRGTIPARVMLSHAIEHIPDNNADTELDPEVRRRTPNKAVLGVPMLRDGRLEGWFVLGRTVAKGFSQRQIDLVQTFADQALIAIENARLFEQVQTRTRELAQSLDDLRRTQDRLIQTEKLASLGALTAGIAHEIKNPLNFVNNFSALSVELLDELQEILAPQPISGTARAEIDDLTTMLKGNLEKVVSHGKRADGIVKNMLLHSRESGGERRSVDLNATVEEALNLAYHGARAEKPGFNVTLERHYDPAAGTIELYPQEFTRVLLNLIANGFYAGARRQAETTDPAFEPTLTVTTQSRPDAVIIGVRDNGIGIPDAMRAKIFEPFFTTKPAGEGTGLGLSLSHDIVVKQHGGTIIVQSTPGEFTEFTVTLPRGGAGAAP